MIKVKNLNYSFHDGKDVRVIFDDVNISFESGKMYALLGDSGSGKTSFLSMVGGRNDNYTGTISFNDQDIRNIGLTTYKNTYVSTVFQNYNLIPYLNAIDNIKIGLDISNNVEKKEAKDILTFLQELGINNEMAKRKVSSLSGGEQQRVAITRSVLMNMPLILADEPTGNLDRETSWEIVNLLKSLTTKNNKCVIMVTHNEQLASIADKVYIINSITHKIDAVR